MLALFTAPDLTIFCGRLLAAGMAACADLAERARARRDSDRIPAAVDAASELVSWVDQMAGVPFTDHPFVARSQPSGPPGMPSGPAWAVPATPPRGARPRKPGKTWAARTGPRTPGGGTPRRSWTLASPPAAAAAALRAAAAAAEGHAPLLAEIRTLAAAGPHPAAGPTRYLPECQARA